MPPRQKARGTPNFNFTVDGLSRTACAGALLFCLGLAAGTPAGAQPLVGSADCAAEQAVMRRMGAPESVIRGALHPPGVDTGATAAALSAMRDTLREALSIAQAGGMKQDAATFGLNLCAYSAAIARQPGGAVASASANQPGNASPPARHTKAVEPDQPASGSGPTSPGTAGMRNSGAPQQAQTNQQFRSDRQSTMSAGSTASLPAAARGEGVDVAADSSKTWTQCLRVRQADDRSCGREDDFTVAVTNTCDAPVSAQVCFERKNGTGNCGTNELNPGATRKFYTCSGTGHFKYIGCETWKSRKGNCSIMTHNDKWPRS
jgi:hypothetical protein